LLEADASRINHHSKRNNDVLVLEDTLNFSTRLDDVVMRSEPPMENDKQNNDGKEGLRS